MKLEALTPRSYVVEAARFSDAFWLHPTTQKFNPTAVIIMAIIPIRIWRLLVIEHTLLVMRCAPSWDVP